MKNKQNWLQDFCFTILLGVLISSTVYMLGSFIVYFYDKF